MDSKSVALIKRDIDSVERTEVTEPERQFGGPQSGLPPPYIIGSDVAPYLIIGIDFGSRRCELSTYHEGAPRKLEPFQPSALVEDAFGLETSGSQSGHSLKRCLAENSVVKYKGECYSSVEVTANYFRRIRKDVQSVAQRMVAKAVIAVPACFNHLQRKNLIAAAHEAELEILALLNEPTAAALDACYRNDFRTGKYLVMSGGRYTCDLSLSHVQNKLLEVKATLSLPSLSGDSLTDLLMEFVENDFPNATPEDLRIALEEANVCTGKSLQVALLGHKMTYTRNQLNSLFAEKRDAFAAALTELLSVGQTPDSEVAGFITAGKGAKLWFFEDFRTSTYAKFHAEFQGNIASGAGLYAGILTKQIKDWVVWDSLPLPVVVAQGNSLREIIPAHSPVPITGHLNMTPSENGNTSAAIMQKIPESVDPVLVATISIEEELPPSTEGATVDFTIAVTANGILSFAARHTGLGLNLTVTANSPSNAGPLIEVGEVTNQSPMKVLDIAGLTILQDDDGSFVDAVRFESDAFFCKIEVYDRLLSINDVSVSEAHVLETWNSEVGGTNQLILARGGFLYKANLVNAYLSDAEVKKRWREDVVKATTTGQDDTMIRALYAHALVLLDKVSCASDIRELKPIFQRCLRLATQSGSHFVLLESLCSLTRLQFCFTHIVPYSQRNCRNILLEIEPALAKAYFPYPPAAAKVIIELAFSLNDFPLDYFCDTAKRLLTAGLALGGKALPFSVIREVLKVLDAPLPQDFKSPELLIGLSDPAKATNAFDNSLLASMKTEALLRLAPDAAEEFRLIEAENSFLFAEMQSEFPYQTALSYRELGRWWLAHEAIARQPDDIDISIMRQRCYTCIAYLDNSRKAFGAAESILQNLLHTAQIENDDIAHAKCLAAIAPVMAGLNRVSDASFCTNQLRKFWQNGVKIIHSTVTDVCDVFITAGMYSAALTYCDEQRRILVLRGATEQAEYLSLLWNLARIHAAEKDEAGCVSAYLLLIDETVTEPFAQLRYQIELARFLFAVGNPEAESEIDKAEQLALLLGVIEDGEKQAWRERCFNRNQK